MDCRHPKNIKQHIKLSDPARYKHKQERIVRSSTLTFLCSSPVRVERFHCVRQRCMLSSTIQSKLSPSASFPT